MTLRLRRSFLYMPAHIERMVRKAVLEVKPDVVCMDCEDSVDAVKKAAAREAVPGHLKDLNFGRCEAAVRLNPVGSPECEEDIRAVLSGPRVPDALVIPKTESIDHLKWVVDRVSAIASSRSDSAAPRALVMMCESPAGLLELPAMLRWARGREATGGGETPRLEACVFGGDDYAAGIGATRTRGNVELLWARQSVVNACRAYGVQPIDIVDIHFRQENASHLESECRQGATFGFEGKQCIHPSQVPVVNRLFSPAADRVAWARGVLQADREGREQGRGAFALGAAMIDAPTVMLARQVVERAERASSGAGEEMRGSPPDVNPLSEDIF